MRPAFSVIFLCLAVGLASSCRGDAGSSPVIATVNKEEIRRSEFEEFLKLKMGEFNRADIPDSISSQMLDEYIRRRLVLEEAAASGLTITGAEVEQAAGDNPPMKPSAALAASREEIVNNLLVEKYYRQVLLRDLRVPAEEVQRYVEANQAQLIDRPGYYVREIRVQSRELLERLRKDVIEGGKNFAAASREHSDAPNAERGGLARYDEGQLPGVLAKAIEPLRPGDVSQIIQSNYGFHLFKLERRIQPHPPDDRRSQVAERRSQLAEEFVARRNQQAVDEGVERLVLAASVKISDADLGFTYSGRFRHN
ncbi:MAG TPA: peptidylprolyl isomerase [Blastocatellia bacterium]|nr:peptidylprolyl isomerase [Blastocatellia bacterium]